MQGRLVLLLAMFCLWTMLGLLPITELAASRHPEVPPLTELQQRALQRFREIATEVSIHAWLQPGDLQVGVNAAWLISSLLHSKRHEQWFAV